MCMLQYFDIADYILTAHVHVLFSCECMLESIDNRNSLEAIK